MAKSSVKKYQTKIRQTHKRTLKLTLKLKRYVLVMFVPCLYRIQVAKTLRKANKY